MPFFLKDTEGHSHKSNITLQILAKRRLLDEYPTAVAYDKTKILPEKDVDGDVRLGVDGGCRGVIFSA